MDVSKIITIAAIVVLVVVGIGAAFHYYKKQNLEKFFNQIYDQSKQIPKQKKNSFLLLMFKESILAAMKKSDQSSFARKLQNPKYLEIQLAQMTKVLKDSSNVQDKTMKQALKLLQDYQAWEIAKIAKDQEKAESKTS